jgi:hypothetical protein
LLHHLKITVHHIIIGCMLLCALPVAAQFKVKGTVYDSARVHVIESVVVMSTGGKGALTDSMGHYEIPVSDKDSIWFSFLGKSTPKYAVQKIPDVTQFDIAIRLKMDVMKEVKIRTRSYKEDSVQNRRDYAKVFDFQRPTVGSMTSIGPNGAGIDLDELIRVFQFKRNRSMEKFRERLLQEERDKYVDHRFSKLLVHRLTGLEGKELDDFMQKYRPPYEFAITAGDYDFQLYIKKAYEEYKEMQNEKLKMQNGKVSPT